MTFAIDYAFLPATLTEAHWKCLAERVVCAANMPTLKIIRVKCRVGKGLKFIVEVENT